MTASLLLLGLAWTLPVGFLGWSYYQHRVSARRATPCHIVTKTVHVDLHSDAWMVTTHDEAAMRHNTVSSYQTEIAKGQAVVRLQKPNGTMSYRRCDTFLN